MSPPEVRLEQDRVRVGPRLAISFQRTLRIPEDGRAYALPPGLGRFPIRRAADYPDRLPRAWRHDFFLPMYRREALWIGFEGAWWKPCAVKVGVGGIDAVSGEHWDETLRDQPQNYLVVPEQPWLDGINSGDETVRQFVAMPIGEGYSVEAQVTGGEDVGGIQLVAFEPRPGRFPDEEPPVTGRDAAFAMPMATPQTMGIAAGGTMRQKIYPDSHGLQTWDSGQCAAFSVHLLGAADFSAVTGEKTPPTPVDAATYAAAGLPWFELYDEDEGDVAAPGALARIKSIRELEGRGAEKSVEVAPAQLRKLRRRK